MVAPALAALLRRAALDVRRHFRPVGALRLEESQQIVLLFGPVPLLQPGLQHFLPSLQALHVVATRNPLRDVLPLPLAQLAHRAAKQLVLLGRPLLRVFLVLFLSTVTLPAHTPTFRCGRTLRPPGPPECDVPRFRTPLALAALLALAVRTVRTARTARTA